MQSQTSRGILFAILACLLWSGNFIVARGVHEWVPPITLAFLRWITATLLLFIIAYKKIAFPKAIWEKYWPHFLWVALTGVAIFNTLLYVAGHYASAISMALIGTTSSPVFTFLLAIIFLKEAIPRLRLLGLLICIAGILLLISKGSINALLGLQFGRGEMWVLLAGLVFAVYNILVRQKPKEISAVTYLFVTFLVGTLMLMPAMIAEQSHNPGIDWSPALVFSVLYIGAGASVAAFFLWNAAIGALGAARTSIFGNLIPVFSSIEAVLLLNEKIEWFQWVGMLIVATGLVLANITLSKKV